MLQRDEAGQYWLVTPAERGRIAVEDVPFLAVELDIRGHGRGQELVFRTNLDEIVIADRDHPLRVETGSDGAPRPYLHVRDGLDARLVRPVFYQLVESGCERTVAGAPVLGAWSKAVFFPLGPADG